MGFSRSSMGGIGATLSAKSCASFLHMSFFVGIPVSLPARLLNLSEENVKATPGWRTEGAPPLDPLLNRGGEYFPGSPPDSGRGRGWSCDSEGGFGITGKAYGQKSADRGYPLQENA